MATSATQIHEIGHSLNIGRADDKYRFRTLFNNFEVYSETVEDDTPDTVGQKYVNKRWPSGAKYRG